MEYKIEWCGGMMPNQAEGTLGDQRFYFRGRHGDERCNAFRSRRGTFRDMVRAIYAEGWRDSQPALTYQIPDTHVIVPKEPTPEMARAWNVSKSDMMAFENAENRAQETSDEWLMRNAKSDWIAMLEAALLAWQPQPASKGSEGIAVTGKGDQHEN